MKEWTLIDDDENNQLKDLMVSNLDSLVVMYRLLE